MRKIDPILQEKLNKLISSMGYELVGCEFTPQGRQILFRIYIDAQNGVKVDDCSLVSRQVSAMLDVEDPIPSRYILEVSSPGLDRPLFNIDQFRQHVGRRVKLKLSTHVDERRQYKGILQRVEEDKIVLLTDDTKVEVVLPFSAIDKANIVADVKF